MDNGDFVISLRLQASLIAGSLLLLFLIIQLIRKGKLKEGYAILWFILGIASFVFSLWKNLLFVVSDLIGVYYAPAALFIIIFSLLILLFIHFSVVISKQEKQITRLIQEIGLMQSQKKNHQNQ